MWPASNQVSMGPLGTGSHEPQPPAHTLPRLEEGSVAYPKCLSPPLLLSSPKFGMVAVSSNCKDRKPTPKINGTDPTTKTQTTHAMPCSHGLSTDDSKETSYGPK
ncbi:hypothetical protein E2C01_010874 [Portunus trituberculatus]|uniref:Uncharacterized protein n=1 Tax=Portunus trituberculatus TaxID=210409 RepID=A0A5B7D9W4_PORTR|nr:hypothetical protein [Portunus trituberculatus]